MKCSWVKGVIKLLLKYEMKKKTMLVSSFPVLIYSCTEKGQQPILLKSEIDSTSYKIPKLDQTIIMFT